MRHFLVIIFSLALSLTASAQMSNLIKAKKLIGRTDKLEEARSLVKTAMDSTATRDLADTYYLAGRIEWGAYDKNSKANSITPGAVNKIDVAHQLLNGYRYFDKAVSMDTAKNKKGIPSPKFTKEIHKRMADKINDFDYAASIFFNDPEKKNYMAAYDAYMIFADSPYRKEGKTIPDSLKAKIYFTAGRAAWNDGEYEKAATAFGKARQIETEDPMACIYEIASWLQVQQKNPAREQDAKNAILMAAKDGYQKFGLSNPYIIHNLINTMIHDGQSREAVDFLTSAIAENPDRSELYGLRAFVYDYLKDDANSEKDYRQYASMHNVSYDTMRDAIYKLVSIGSKKWEALELKDPQLNAKKNDLKANYFLEAKKWIEKMNSPSNHPGDFDDILEIIYYHINQ